MRWLALLLFAVLFRCHQFASDAWRGGFPQSIGPSRGFCPSGGGTAGLELPCALCWQSTESTGDICRLSGRKATLADFFASFLLKTLPYLIVPTWYVQSQKTIKRLH
jgi:hypothetical protein